MTPPAVLRFLQRFDVFRAEPSSAPAAVDSPAVAMQAALAEGAGAGPAHELALVLVRSGVVNAETTAALEPWRRTALFWRQRALTGAKISDFLLRHGFRPMTPTGVAQVDAAIADPLTVLDEPAPLWEAIFGRQLVECVVDGVGLQPRADRLLWELCAATRPKVELEDLRQALEPGRWRVAFRCLGQRHAFAAAHRGSVLDVEAVVRAFNALMEHVGHPCRAFRIDRPEVPAPGSAAQLARAWIVITRGERFGAAARAIGIPLAAPGRVPRVVDPTRRA